MFVVCFRSTVILAGYLFLDEKLSKVNRKRNKHLQPSEEEKEKQQLQHGCKHQRG